jgi:hypothetical protein
VNFRLGSDGGCAAVTRFVAEQRENIGAHPFLQGLRALMEAQLEAPVACLVWRTPHVLLSQSGGEHFMATAVALLRSGLGFSLLPQNVGGEGVTSTDDGCADWQTHPGWSDVHARAVLRRLPGEHELEGRAAGTILPQEAPPRCSVEDIAGAWCSFCVQHTIHAIWEKNTKLGRRSIYRCRGCGGRTLPCWRGAKGCPAMTKGGRWDNDKCSVCAKELGEWPQPPPRVGAQVARPPKRVTTRIEPLLREVPQEELAQADQGCTGEDDDELVEECLSRGAEISSRTVSPT